MVKNHADNIQKAYPSGPYNLIGWSFGGVVAHELAIELQRRGCRIGPLILLDAQPELDSSVTLPEDQALGERHILEELLRVHGMGAPDRGESPTYEQIEELVRARGAIEHSRFKELLGLLVQNLHNNISRYRTHEPRVFQGDVRIFAAVGDQPDRGPFLSENWRPYISGNIVMYSVGCPHNEMLTPESVGRYGKPLNRLLVRVERQLELAPIGRFDVARRDDDELGGERAG